MLWWSHAHVNSLLKHAHPRYWWYTWLYIKFSPRSCRASDCLRSNFLHGRYNVNLASSKHHTSVGVYTDLPCKNTEKFLVARLLNTYGFVITHVSLNPSPHCHPLPTDWLTEMNEFTLHICFMYGLPKLPSEAARNYTSEVRFKARIWLVRLGFIRVGLGLI